MYTDDSRNVFIKVTHTHRENTSQLKIKQNKKNEGKKGLKGASVFVIMFRKLHFILFKFKIDAKSIFFWSVIVVNVCMCYGLL